MVQDKAQSIFDDLHSNPNHTVPDGTQVWLDRVLNTYWCPARQYFTLHKYDSVADRQLKDQWALEYKRRYALFVQECTELGFQIKRTRNGNFIARDWTKGRSKEWMLPGKPLLESYINYSDLLDELWKTPTAFREQTLHLECEINDRLRTYEHSAVVGVDYSRLVQILSPFLPKVIRQSILALDEPNNTTAWRLQYELKILDYLQKLAESASLAWMNIGYPDPLPSGGDGQMEDCSYGLLYYYPPSAILADAPEPIPSLITLSQSDTIPVSFRRMEQDMNHLLRKRRAGVLDFDDHDRLRTLFYAVMDPTLRNLEDHLRIDDARWRAGQLTADLMADYTEKSAHFYRLFDRWMDSFMSEDIHLYRVEPHDPSPNSLVLQIQNAWDLPANFRSSELAVPILNIQNAVNEYLLSQSDKTDRFKELFLTFFFS
jgi:hypothetical protein